MRELTLKYFINLVSNIREKTGDDTKALMQAQDQIQKALGKSEAKLTSFERTLIRVGGMRNAGLERQAQYFAQIAMSADRATKAVDRVGRAMQMTARGVAGAMAGGAAGFMVAKAALDKPMDYDTRLREASATAFAGRDSAALAAGHEQVKQLINMTVRGMSGATRDSTLGAFQKMAGLGAWSYDESAKLLPEIMRTSVASRADPMDLVQASEKMKTSFGLSPAEIKVALAKLMRGGQEGGFEIKDSARWIGPLAEYFKGYKGMAGVEAMVTMLQQVRSTAGSNDEAANNLRNFVAKMGSEGTRKDFEKQGFDLTAEMASGAVRGETPVDTYMRMLDKVMAKQDPQGKARAAMRTADSGLTPEERQQRYEQVAKLYESAGIGTIINDLQEMGGYAGLVRTKEYGKKVLAAVQSETGGAVDVGYGHMTGGTSARSVDIANRKDIAMSDALDKRGGTLNSAMDKVVELTDKFPEVASSAATAAVALTALAAAGAVAAFTTGGGAGGGALKKVGGLVSGGAGKLAALFTAGKFASGMGAGAVAGGAAVPAAIAAGALTAGAFNVYQMLRLGDAATELYNVKNRQGVRLSADAQARIEGGALANAGGLDFMTLSAPGQSSTQMAPGQTSKIEVGQGVLDLNVRVTDERVRVTPGVTRQPSLIRINPGATRPEGTW